ncbi:GNAT family acetyltransferase [Leptolyngbya valderiana BDU 20041]|nr:GNAT family acetyltransferase [Leptolyngbya valderiana BDU 20041]
MSNWSIRKAQAGDEDRILTLIRDLALYEKEPEQAVATPADITQALFSETPTAECVLAERDGETLGFALFFTNFSTWTGRPGLYLEDLFVRETARGSGIGKALLLHLASIARERGYGRMEWSVLDWNQPAIDFYESLGAKPMDGWTVYRLDRAALIALDS